MIHIKFRKKRQEKRRYGTNFLLMCLSDVFIFTDMFNSKIENKTDYTNGL